MKSVMWNRVSVALASLGVFVAGLLSYEKISPIEIPCGAARGCETVSASPLSVWFNVPVAFFGLAAYVAFLVLGILRGSATGERWRQFTMIGFVMSAIGFGGSIYLSYVALAVIRATCIWCLASALLMTLLFIAHTLLITSEAPKETDRAVNLWAMIGGVAALFLAVGFGLTSAAQTPGVSEMQVDLAKVNMAQFEADPRKSKGNENAKVTLLEFLDVNCPPCRRSYPKVDDVFKEHGGRLRVGYRHQPNPQIEGHETSMFAAIVLEYAAEEGKFWDVLNAYMADENVNSVKSKNGLQLLATSAGMPEAVVEEALGAPQGAQIDAVSSDMLFASQEIMSQGTPTFILVAEGQPPRFVTIEKLPEVLRTEPYRSLLK